MPDHDAELRRDQRSSHRRVDVAVHEYEIGLDDYAHRLEPLHDRRRLPSVRP